MKNKPGRPTIITTEVVSILISSFQNGMTVREACWQSGISHEAYYNRLRNDEHFTDIMNRAQNFVNLKAKTVVIEAINKGDLGSAKWWLERKAISEFGKSTASTRQDSNTSIDEEIFITDEELDYALFGNEKR